MREMLRVLIDQLRKKVNETMVKIRQDGLAIFIHRQRTEHLPPDSSQPFEKVGCKKKHNVWVPRKLIQSVDPYKNVM